MRTFPLYRVRRVLPAQTDLFHESVNSTNLLMHALEEMPATRSSKRIWQFGNVQRLEDKCFYFRFGATSKSEQPHYDEEKKAFTDELEEQARYTEGVVDCSIEVAAIAHLAALGTDSAIARHVAGALSSAQAARGVEAYFEVLPISDPVAFLQHVQEAEKITRFYFSVGKPNPFDAEKDFQEPAEKFAARANAKSLSIAAYGDLNRDTVTDIAKAASRGGHDATAVMKSGSESEEITKKMSENKQTIQSDVLNTMSKKMSFINKLREAFRSLS